MLINLLEVIKSSRQAKLLILYLIILLSNQKHILEKFRKRIVQFCGIKNAKQRKSKLSLVKRISEIAKPKALPRQKPKGQIEKKES